MAISYLSVTKGSLTHLPSYTTYQNEFLKKNSQD